MLETDVAIQSGATRLAGTFCLPACRGTFPAVLMIHGSGPLDRDENMKGQSLDIFNTVARGLAEAGIASLRYDKRGCGASGGHFFQAGHADLVADAANCLDAMARFEGVKTDAVFLLGHSEGCIIAPQVSLQRPIAAGMILLCPFLEFFESLLLRQAAQLDKEAAHLPGWSGWAKRFSNRIIGSSLALQKRLIQKVKHSSSPMIRFCFTRQPAKWYRELMALDPSGIFSRTTAPMLLIGGENDLQCQPDDVFKIASIAKGKSEAWIVENMNHLLRLDENPPSLAGIARTIKAPMEPIVIERIVQWIRKTACQPQPCG